jgi:hypothetical protein
MGFWSDVSGALGIGSGDPSNPYRNALGGQGGVGQTASGLAATATGNYTNATNALGSQQSYLQGQMQGQDSVSMQQLQQGLQQNLATQQSMAASANPNNSAMAARNAAQNMGQAANGLAGQQAVAGLQERNQATQNLSNLNLGMQSNASQTALGGLNAATGAYGTALGTPQKTWGSTIGGALSGLASAGAAAIKSDKTLKTDIKSGDDEASKVMSGLKAKTYSYKDQSLGQGKHLGVMAQDLEKAGLKQAVIDTPKGKVLHVGKLAGANTAMIAALHQRVSKLEKSSGKSKPMADDDGDED